MTNKRTILEAQAPVLDLRVGDHVSLRHAEHKGTVTEVTPGRFSVSWDSTWATVKGKLTRHPGGRYTYPSYNSRNFKLVES